MMKIAENGFAQMYYLRYPPLDQRAFKFDLLTTLVKNPAITQNVQGIVGCNWDVLSPQIGTC